MCGIVGAYLQSGSVVESLVEGLRVLEYRGYDSSGIGVIGDQGVLVRRKVGRLANLEEELRDGALKGGRVGIGHTRWATHGEPSDGNAHPHLDASGRVAVVHNGIIENYVELRRDLEREGIQLSSQTDTEIVAHLVGLELDRHETLIEAVRAALQRVEGYYALAVVGTGEEPELVCARQGPPLCVGLNGTAAYLGSDLLALLPHTRDIHFLEDGDLVELRPGSLTFMGMDGQPVERPSKHVDWDAEAADRGGFPHYMLKEIHEQPAVLARTCADHLSSGRGEVVLDGGLWTDESLRSLSRVQITACGTALHAGYIGRYMIEGLAGIPVDIDYASEFRYRDPQIVPDTMCLAISQSGETADTLAAQRLAVKLGARPAGICNVMGSTLVRECESILLTQAGPEIGVASTKAFVAQVVASYLLAVRMGRARGTLTSERAGELLDDLRQLRPRMEQLLSEDTIERVRKIAEELVTSKGFMFLGRGINYPVALEGALKLKEISYMHAEGYPAGEMKHGPIALIEPGMSTLVVNSKGRVAEKVRSNIEQVRARGGYVVAVGSDPSSLELADAALPVPECNEWLSPVLNVVPLQLFSYMIADLRGCDIDKPRNLAKSVTVE